MVVMGQLIRKIEVAAVFLIGIWIARLPMITRLPWPLEIAFVVVGFFFVMLSIFLWLLVKEMEQDEQNHHDLMADFTNRDRP